MSYTGYVIQTETGGEYIGITNNLSRRLREHKHAGPLKGLALEVILREDFQDRVEAGKWEIEQIAARGGPDKLLNTSFGGFGGRSRVVSEAEREHLSRLATDRQSTPEFREAMSEACKAAWANPKLRAEMSQRSKMVCSRPGEKGRRSALQKSLWKDPTIRAKRIAGITKSRNDPAKAKARSEAARKMWETRRSQQV